jgi:putative transcriptional regulator
MLKMRIIVSLCAICVQILMTPGTVFTGSENPAALAKGKFIISTPQLNDPRFREKVVLLLQYGEKSGSLGLILNYPTKVNLSDAFPKRNLFKRKSQQVYIGGPVGMKQVFSLIRLRGSTEDREMPELQKVFGDVYLTSGEENLETVVEKLKPYEELRVYIGYAGWAAGQLEFEMKTGHWLVWNADPAMIFNTNPAEVWPEMLRRSSVIEAEDSSILGRFEKSSKAVALYRQ